jgi:hypothetical protein
MCLAIGAAASDGGAKTITVPLDEPEIVRVSSTKYLVKCRSGKEHTLVLEGAQESSAAGPKNVYVPDLALRMCNKSPIIAK